MDDNKEKELDEALTDENTVASEKESAETSSENEELKNEMEELAKTFQQELDKAKAQAKEVAETEPEEPEILIQDLEDISEGNNEAAQNNKENIPEGELCECCGERRRGTKNNPDSPYCIDCERALRHYPFNFLSVIIAVFVIGLSFYACYVFANDTDIYVASKQADDYVEKGQLYTAYSTYSELANTMVNDSMNCEFVYKRAFINTFNIGGYDYLSDLTTKFKPWEVKLPHLRSIYNDYEFVESFNRTRTDGYSIIYQYASADVEAKDLPYDEIIAELDKLVSTPVPATTAAASSSTTTTTTPYSISATTYCKPMISFLKFYVAAICEKDYATQISFLEEIKNEYPEMSWLYGSMLGDAYAKSGVDVTDYCEFLRSMNKEDSGADVIEAIASRIKGDYSKCIEIGKNKILESDDYSYEFYRQNALCYLAQGNYQAAYENANQAYTAYNSSIQVCDTLALCSLAAGNADAYASVEKLFTDSGMTLSDEVLGYKAGTLSLDDILLKGDYDVQ